MYTKEGVIRYPGEDAATKPPSELKAVDKNINFTNGRLIIKETSTKIDNDMVAYSRNIQFQPKKGGKETIYREYKEIKINNLPIFGK